MDRVYDLGFVKVIITDKDFVFEEDGEKYLLSDEIGWWTEDGKVYVWGGIKEKVEVAVHEIVEYILVVKLRLSRGISHRIASVVEAGVGMFLKFVKYMKTLVRRCRNVN